ncbi:hypothetical protein K458DRAFT_185591 [Lentithecium fluviatile CBS 122367]|uniref:Uncharacterized protein n=1 Tax=Lentithecium fluviatile CBS 122367 TaxID=1168545 RepID=A0A6G1JAC4_9PLEO|nr:hypothetical protein K458DRAFT_185591 [Lentithecium fluviatile CBS 122367]
MGYDVEDEVDWSDGSLDPKSPPCAESVQPAFDPAAEEQDQKPLQSESESHEQWSLPFGEPLPLAGSAGTPSASKFGLSRLQRSRIGVRSNRREPTRGDYADYVLYQANQKTYEAVFLKTFVNHALHPDQLSSILPHNGDPERVTQYLQTVSNNVNQIVTKMIWNAHSRTVNLLANDGKQGAHFWDFQQFDKSSFYEFDPEHAISVVHHMHESWHRAFDPPPMVRYTTKDYPIGKHSSPFEEIDEVSETLFTDKAKVVHKGRAVKLPSKKRKARGSLAGVARREIEIDSRGNWLHDLTTPYYGKPGSNQSVFENNRLASLASSQKGVPVGDCKIHVEEDGHSNPAIQSNDLSQAIKTHEQPSRLEILVDRYGPDVLMQDLPAPFAWRTKLVDDHKRRLAERWPHSKKSVHTLDLSIKAIVEQAVTGGIIQPPAAEMREKIDVAARIDQRKKLRAALEQRKHAKTSRDVQPDAEPLLTHCSTNKGRKRAERAKTAHKAKSGDALNKKRKTEPRYRSGIVGSGESVPLPPHPSGSTTLEPHQVLPPEAYFERSFDEEQPAWRCGINHAMGYYYNAGDRKNCVGCFTSIDHNPRLKRMDFYLPSRSHFHQPAPGVIWNPSKQQAKVRRSKQLSHNSIAKEAFWDAINTGASAQVARRRAVEAVVAHLRPKTPPREPTPMPTHEPLDLGPHPSGSKTMEHGQDLPECAYWEKKERGEEFAWRCDVNHALGRYYLSGNKRTCPGCGSNKDGPAKHAKMDFYLPDGVVVRQEAPDLVKWHPRKPYKTTRTEKLSKHKGKQIQSHNQICSKKYWDAIEASKEHEDALALAIAGTDAFLDAKNEEVRIKHEGLRAKLDAAQKAVKACEDEESSVRADNRTVSTSRGHIVSLLPRKRGSTELSLSENENENDAATDYETGQDVSRQAAEIEYITSSDESTSSSDSE